MSLSGDMINCEYILNLIYKCKNFPEDVKEKEIFKMIFEIYTNIFETANRSSIKSLAVPFIEIENEQEISLKALIEAIIYITELFDNKDQSLKYLYLISEDEKILTKFDNLATNGFNLEFIIYKTPTQNQKPKSEILPVKNSQNNEMDKMVYLKKTKNFEDFYNQCGICGKNSLLLSNFLDEDFLKNCSKFKRNCKICSTAKNTANFFHKNNSIKSDTFCIYCAGDFIDKLKYSLCSSCLRNIDKAKSVRNKYCNKDMVCYKCDGLPENTGKNCYLCEFYVFFQKLEEKKMILDHDLISCCFDYCTLSEVKHENIYKLSCGHTSCAKISNMSKLCSLCAVNRLIENLNQRF